MDIRYEGLVAAELQDDGRDTMCVKLHMNAGGYINIRVEDLTDNACAAIEANLSRHELRELGKLFTSLADTFR